MAKPQSRQDLAVQVINMRRPVPVKETTGATKTIPKGEALSVYPLRGGNALLKDGDEYVVNKGQLQNILGNAVKGEAKEFAPELRQVEETTKSDNATEAQKYLNNLKAKYGMDDINGAWTAEEERKYNGLTWKNADNPTKYSQYSLPSGTNYREILLRAPTQVEKLDKLAGEGKLQAGEYGQRIMAMNPMPSYKSSHWDEPNVLSHLLMKDRQAKNKKVGFIEELQSDWAREGREKGFSDNTQPITELPAGVTVNGDDTGYTNIHDANGRHIASGLTREEAIQNALKNLNIQKSRETIPSHPLLKDWVGLTLKRALKEAVDSGADYLSWASGDQIKNKYNLSKQVDQISWDKGTQEGETTIHIGAKGGNNIGVDVDKTGKVTNTFWQAPNDWIGKNLPDVIGKGVAEKILTDKDGKGELKGEGLNIGGTWANNLYDREIAAKLKDITGQESEKLDLGIPKDTHEGQERYRWDDGPDVLPVHLNHPSWLGKMFTSSDVHDAPSGQTNRFNFTKNLGDGKFKAIPETDYIREYPKQIKAHPNHTHQELVAEIAKHPRNMTFDMEPPIESETQQALRLTPQIKALVRGEPLPLKQPSGITPVSPAFQLREQYTPESISKAKEIRGIE